MNTDLKEFVGRYLAIVSGTFMSVSTVAFVCVPYILSSSGV
ncbi:hypothetical protein [Rhodoferax sp.]|nr:hypothetical protein [Rhodoferax sp.]MDD2808431.1 hypothetical protein [Rhodoferax sp.]MDD4944698.1 hypothetical protein [Rhodoferax sp.]MDD5480874.1 hypothetical protein [Rhodoferax sp.]